jgi:hypothetical protein
VPEPTVPIDQAARDRIVGDLETTLFVEAGAGTGKTSALVDRIVSLVVSGVSVEHIAAITFTDRAATELRDRVRRRLEAMATAKGAEADVAGRALVELDGAALCTLHAFAQRILVEHPIEAGLPPAVEVMDEVSSLVDFDERWAGVVDTLLSDPRHALTVLVAFELGISLRHLRDMAHRLDDKDDDQNFGGAIAGAIPRPDDDGDGFSTGVGVVLPKPRPGNLSADLVIGIMDTLNLQFVSFFPAVQDSVKCAFFAGGGPDLKAVTIGHSRSLLNRVRKIP